MSTFRGFGPDTKKFLRALGRNNTKTWFDAHRQDYEAHYLEPAKAFIESAGPRLEKLAPNLVWEPRVNGSIFRVNRDIRFSKDKTPYKDHIDLWFWEGQRKTALSGFFLRIRHDRVHLGAGSHGFAKDALARYRKRLNDEKPSRALSSLVGRLHRAGYDIGGEHYKKPPRGFSGSGEAAKLVLHSALWASAERKAPPELGSAKFVTYCVRDWKKLLPLHQWLINEVGA